MKKFRYLYLAVTACAIVTLSSCNDGTSTTENSPSASTPNSVAQTTEAVSHSSHGSKNKLTLIQLFCLS